MKSKIFTHIISSLIAITALSGCGNLMKANLPTPPKSSQQTANPATSSTVSSVNGNFTCPNQANVLPDVDVYLNGSDDFTVCPSTQNATDILIHGKTQISAQICVCPVSYVDSTHVYWKPDVATGAPLFQCSDETSAGVTETFTNMNYNAVYIVEGPYKDAMIACLVEGNAYACPHYSFGEFRTVSK